MELCIGWCSVHKQPMMLVVAESPFEVIRVVTETL